MQKNSFKEWAIDNLKSLAWAFIVAMIIRTFVVEPFQIPSSSMKPNLLIGDFIFVNKYTYGFSKQSFPLGKAPFSGRIFSDHKPERGDVVVFRLNSIFYIKRLVGLPGDKIQMLNGVLYINNQPLSKVYHSTYTDEEYEAVKMFTEKMSDHKKYETLDLYDNGLFDNTMQITVPQGHYFMMGDNRDASNDSRADLGFVPYEDIVGKAFVIFFSINGDFFKFWEWPNSIRFSRIFHNI